MTGNTTAGMDIAVAGIPTGHGAAVHTNVEAVAEEVSIAVLTANDVGDAIATDGLRPKSRREKDLKKIH